jgi:hypothetical protein
MLHWNGITWSQAASTNAAGSLSSVSDIASSGALAVGSSYKPTHPDVAEVSLGMRWTGSTWVKVHTPDPAGTTYTGDESWLTSVSALSATSAWAVGGSDPEEIGRVGKLLIAHWNGTTCVSAISASDVWGVGDVSVGSAGVIKTYTLRWNGSNWTKVASPSPGTAAYESPGYSSLYSVSAVSATNAWAVGTYSTVAVSDGEATLIKHWNGTKWSVA